jgi:hypothetical protein
MSARFWMVYGLHQGAPTARHKTEQSAVTEAKRLARNNPDVEFFVLETTHHVVKRDVDVSRISESGGLYQRDLDDDIPF